MDDADLRRAIMGLAPPTPCIVFHDISPDKLAAIRRAAEPKPPAGPIDVHPYYLEAAHAARQQLQDYLDEAMRRRLVEQALATEATLREVYGYDNTT